MIYSIKCINEQKQGLHMAVQSDLKFLQLRMPKDTWMFLKQHSAAIEVSMTDIILTCLDKYKKKIESKLTV